MDSFDPFLGRAGTPMPRIHPWYFRGDGGDAASEASSGLWRLEDIVADFGAAVRLFEWTGEERQKAIVRHLLQNRPPLTDPELRMFGAWQVMAAREGAMILFHFQKTVQGIKAFARQNARLWKVVDRGELKQAGRIFADRFRHFEEIRDAAAHRAEFAAQFDRHAVKGPGEHGGMTFDDGSAVYIGTSITGSEISTTKDGRMLSYKLDVESEAALIAARDAIYRAFAPGEEDPGVPEGLLKPGPNAADGTANPVRR